MPVRNVEDGITALFGQPFTNRMISVYVPQKVNKQDCKPFVSTLYNSMAKGFGACYAREAQASFMNGGKQIFDDNFVIESHFCDTDKNHLMALKSVTDWCYAFMHMMSIKGVLVGIDSKLYWLHL